MRWIIRPSLCALATATLIAALAVPAAAQSHRGAITLTGGGSVHGDLGPFPTVPAQFQPGWITGLQLERWLGSGRVGLRLGGLWTQRNLDESGASMYNVFSAETDVLIRLRQARTGNAFVPYVGLGAGATHYAGVGSAGTLVDGLYGDPVYRAHVTAALGTDLLASHRTGLRLEVGDQIVLPSIGRSPEAEGLPMVHNLVVTLGFQLRMGRLAGSGMADAEPAPSAERAAGSASPRSEGPDEAAATRDELRARLAAKDREIARLRARIDSLEPAAGAPAPAAEPAAEQAAEPMRPAGDAEARYTVQLGSFVEVATADRWVERLEARGLPVWRADTEVQGQRVSRVRVGALPTEAEAHTLADALDRDYGWPVWVDRIGDGEPIPAGAVQRTRDVLYR